MKVLCGMSILFIIVLIVYSVIKYGDRFEELDKKEYPLKKLYSCGYCIFIFLEKIQKKLGKKIDHTINERMLSELCVKSDVKKEAILHESKKYTYLIITLGVSFSLCLSLAITNGENTDLKNNNQLIRPEYGSKSITYDLNADYEKLDNENIQIIVDAREYAEEELEEIFEKVYQELIQKLIGRNTSLEKVNKNLIFAQSEEYAGINAEWRPADYRLIDSNGKINFENIGEEGRDTSIKLILSCQNKEEIYKIFITIIPEGLSTKEKSKKELLSFINKAQNADKTLASFSLPTQFERHLITYSDRSNKNQLGIILFLGLFIAVLLLINEDMKLKSKSQWREKQMMMDYPEIISKLTILIGAGMTIKGAWFRIVKDYQEKNKEEGGEKRYGYEEMKYTCNRILGGLAEAEAYLEFGKRCRLHSYLKFSNLLEQNLKKGTRGMVQMLQNEASQAFLERKHMAKRYGEKLSTRLMLPMMILFGMVLLIIIVPAFLSFSY